MYKATLVIMCLPLLLAAQIEGNVFYNTSFQFDDRNAALRTCPGMGVSYFFNKFAIAVSGTENSIKGGFFTYINRHLAGGFNVESPKGANVFVRYDPGGWSRGLIQLEMGIQQHFMYVGLNVGVCVGVKSYQENCPCMSDSGFGTEESKRDGLRKRWRRK